MIFAASAIFRAASLANVPGKVEGQDAFVVRRTFWRSRMV